MKISIVAVFCLAVTVMRVDALAAGDGAGTHARHPRTQSSASFKGEMNTTFKSIGHGFKRAGHAVRSVARHTVRRVKAGVHAAWRQR